MIAGTTRDAQYKVRAILGIAGRDEPTLSLLMLQLQLRTSRGPRLSHDDCFTKKCVYSWYDDQLN
ncbi:hypothetical protein J6590_007566 [Homalodisca vitripennis]|nr:hypothetical protein J6590_007566 [Homalodisca vitripennis]